MSEFREMRRKRQQLSDEESVGILQRSVIIADKQNGNISFAYFQWL